MNAGGDLSQINSYFAQFQLKTLDVAAVDLNDDGLDEIVVAGVLPLELKSPGQGVIFILGCKQKAYEIAKHFDFQNISSAEIIRTEKLLVNYPQEAIIQYEPTAGRGSNILAIGFMNSDWRVIFQENEFLPKLIIFDQDNDGNKEISIHSVTNATQGPWKTGISTFKWDGKQYSLASELLMPGTTRVEYLDDAQNALNKNDISMAIAYYDFASHAPSLTNFASRGEIEDKQTDLAGDYQISFALFRLATLWFFVEDFDKGTTIIKELDEEFPTKSPGNEFAQAGNLFREEIRQGKTPKEACNTVTSFLIQNYPKLNSHIGDWGMLVAGYTQLIELCPFQ